MTITDVDDKYAELFRDELARQSLARVNLVEGAYDAEHSTFEALVELPSVEDWSLRHAVLDAATRVEDSLCIRVHTFFRPAAQRLSVAGQ